MSRNNPIATWFAISILTLNTLVVFARPEETLENNEGISKIDQDLLRTLQNKNTVNIFVSFSAGTQDILNAIEDTRFPSREDRLIALANALGQHARTTQHNCTEYLKEFHRNIFFETFWINNQLYIKDADIMIIAALAQYDEVVMIMEETFFNLDVISEPGAQILHRPTSEAEWGIQKIEAVEANEFLKNKTANPGPLTNIRIATIDTGVRHTHEALRNNFVGEFGWFDPDNRTPLPFDNVGHGTHVTGTICGQNGIGVFPNATWMTCKGCATIRCAFSTLISCAQFVTCPTSPDGLQQNCAMAPHVVSNSWGGARGNWLFDEVIEAWHVARIVPLFSIGNSGPRCDTANSPGDRNVIGVGATTIDDQIASFSSKGPSATGEMKPDISAPGKDVVSAYHTGDDAYIAMSGTSMACPHTAGLTSMLLALNADLEYRHVIQYLAEGVEKRLDSEDVVCEGVPGDMFPNHIFGYGRINALRSLQSLSKAKKPHSPIHNPI